MVYPAFRRRSIESRPRRSSSSESAVAAAVAATSLLETAQAFNRPARETSITTVKTAVVSEREYTPSSTTFLPRTGLPLNPAPAEVGSTFDDSRRTLVTVRRKAAEQRTTTDTVTPFRSPRRSGPVAVSRFTPIAPSPPTGGGGGGGGAAAGAA